MAASYNKVILMGNLCRDPELRYTPKGTAVATLSLATNRQWKTESGEQKEEVTFVDVIAFGRQAEVIAQYLKKGAPLFMDGRLKLDSWEDKQTRQKRYKMRVVLENFSFVGGPRNEDEQPRSGAPTGYTQPPAGSVDEEPPPEPDDVPF